MVVLPLVQALFSASTSINTECKCCARDHDREILHNHTHAGQSITLNGTIVLRNNSLGSLSVVKQRMNSPNTDLYPLVCQGITGGQWYEPRGVLFPLEMPGMVNVTLPHGDLGVCVCECVCVYVSVSVCVCVCL